MAEDRLARSLEGALESKHPGRRFHVAPRAREEARRILDREARRLLDEQRSTQKGEGA